MKQTNFKDLNKLLQYVAVPIIMSDYYRLEDLKKLKDKFNELSESTDITMDKSIKQSAFFKYEAIDTYISYLESYVNKFETCVTSNLRGAKIKEELIPKILEEIIKNSVVIASDTDGYNCHGWSLGVVKWLGLDTVTKDDFVKVMTIKKILGLEKDFIDNSINSYFSNNKDLKESMNEKCDIIGYYDKENKLMHTARYIQNLTDWFKYDEDSHEGWYNRKPSDLISFEEDNICLLNGYVSKLGEGFLLVHNSSDIAPLYGDTIVHYDYS